jgi:hypothetical protein
VNFSTSRPMLAMWLRCHHCCQDFPGGVSLRTYYTRGGLFGGVIYECPHCGTREAYIPAEHRIGDLRGVGAMPGSEPSLPGPSPPPSSGYL